MSTLHPRKTAAPLLLCLMLAFYARAAIYPVNPGDNVQGKINAAQAGDELHCRGAFNFVSLVLKSGVTLTTPDNNPATATLTFNTGQTNFGILFPSGATGTKVKGLTIRASAGGIKLNNSNTNCEITHNDIQWATNPSSQSFWRCAVDGWGGGNRGLKIRFNNFHDAMNADRGLNIFDTTGCDFSQNRFINTHDGGHIDGMHKNLTIYYNWCEGNEYMAIFELQNNRNFTPGNAGDNIHVKGNVAIKPREADYNWYGASWMLQNATRFVMEENYVDARDYTLRSGGQRLGYLYEGGMGPSQDSVFRNNVGIGPGWAGLAFSMDNALFHDNLMVCPDFAMSAYMSEPGNTPSGHGVPSAGSVRNRHSTNYADAPPLPNLKPYTGPYALQGTPPTWKTGATTQPLPDPADPPITGTVTKSGMALVVKWTGGKAPYTLTRQPDEGFGQKDVGNTTTYTDTFFKPEHYASTWRFKYFADGGLVGENQLDKPTTQPNPDPPITQPTTTTHDIIFDVVVGTTRIQFKVPVEVTATGARTVKAK